jgi:glutaredoxin
MNQPPEGQIDCPHCHATPTTMDVRITVGRRDGTAASIRHTEDCVDYPTEPERPGEEPTT